MTRREFLTSCTRSAMLTVLLFIAPNPFQPAAAQTSRAEPSLDPARREKLLALLAKYGKQVEVDASTRQPFNVKHAGRGLPMFRLATKEGDEIYSFERLAVGNNHGFYFTLCLDDKSRVVTCQIIQLDRNLQRVGVGIVWTPEPLSLTKMSEAQGASSFQRQIAFWTKIVDTES